MGIKNDDNRLLFKKPVIITKTVFNPDFAVEIVGSGKNL